MFHEGDRVRQSKKGIKKYGDQSSGGVGTVSCNCSPWSVHWDNGQHYNYYQDEITMVSNMADHSLVQKMALVFKGEPEKSFIKAGVMNPDETLTEEGEKVFLAYLLKQNGADFKTKVVDPILAEKDEA
jgi:hypothetical protein